MPGLDFYKSSAIPAREIPSGSTQPVVVGVNEETTHDPDVYYNARLDPKNYLEGPLSWNPATRLRQMLARPGIVVSLTHPRM